MDEQSASMHMIKQQIQPWGVNDPKVLDLLTKIPRDLFVPSAYHTFAYADVCLNLPQGQTMLTPKEEAKILEALAVQPTDTVLEVGTGSGYLTALLASQVPHVYSVDIDPNVTQHVAKKLASLNINNVTVVTGDAIGGWQAQSNYDVILINGSVPFVPKKLCQQLALNGRLLAVIGYSSSMQATLIARQGPQEKDWKIKRLFETDWSRIANPLPEEVFDF